MNGERAGCEVVVFHLLRLDRLRRLSQALHLHTGHIRSALERFRIWKFFAVLRIETDYRLTLRRVVLFKARKKIPSPNEKIYSFGAFANKKWKKTFFKLKRPVLNLLNVQHRGSSLRACP